jgi:hypothetical protein
VRPARAVFIRRLPYPLATHRASPHLSVWNSRRVRAPEAAVLGRGTDQTRCPPVVSIRTLPLPCHEVDRGADGTSSLPPGHSHPPPRAVGHPATHPPPLHHRCEGQGFIPRPEGAWRAIGPSGSSIPTTEGGTSRQSAPRPAANRRRHAGLVECRCLLNSHLNSAPSAHRSASRLAVEGRAIRGRSLQQ